ncbi:MAG: hypothetical protein CL916_13795 [Deltaproteobacteria bacterium]|nr:hypothetical protein [Deltaproteobacteria bacterium]
METNKLELDKLQASLDRLEEYKSYIERASSQKGTFPLSVVQKVILNYELRIEVELEYSRPIMVHIEERCLSVQEELQAIQAQAEQPEELQELDLLYTIGALGEEDYQRQKREIEQSMVVGDEDSLQQEIDLLSHYLHRWSRLQGSENLVQEESLPEAIEDVVEELPAPDLVEEVPVLEPDPSEDLFSKPDPNEDFFAEKKVDTPLPPPPPPLPDHPMDMVEVEDDSISEVQSFPEPAEELVIEESFVEHETFLVDEEPDLGGEQLLNDSFLDEESDFGALGEELPLELEEEPAPDLDIMPSSFDVHSGYEESPVSNDIRSAILLKNEGLPNEEVHTFSGEQYSIGRHQDNDIQIKGDTKVSRRHCKLFRRNGHFYIEDQHSSNGTLVNGELISERRLYGGEELKIGETVFRFRLQ